MYCTGKSMNNLLSYCGLVDVRINASDKDSPVKQWSKPGAMFVYMIEVNVDITVVLVVEVIVGFVVISVIGVVVVLDYITYSI